MLFMVTMMKNKTKTELEVWRPYPEFDFIEGSNLGRARTLDRVVSTRRGTRVVKGRILTQHSNGTGYMQVGPRINGKKVNIYTHRLVAECFLPNQENLPEINHKDNNPRNNNISNLEWCSHKYNIAYKEKHGTSAKEAAPKLPIYAVELKTQEVLRFESQSDAERSLGVAQQSISAVLKGKLKTAGGFWFIEDNGKVDKDKLRKNVISMLLKGGIIAVNLKTQKVLWFKTQSEAGLKLKGVQGHIGDVIKGRRKQAGNYWFTHADNNATKNTRAKFGDKVANKVEKLIEGE